MNEAGRSEAPAAGSPRAAGSGTPSVLHVVDSLETGGLERVVTDLAIAQRDRGLPVAVFSLLRTDGFRAQLEAAGIPVISGAKSGTFDRETIAAMRRELARRSVDVVHTHSFVPNYYAAVALLGRRRTVLLSTCHDMGTRLARRRLRMLYRLSLLRTARVAMVGQQVRDRFVSLGVVASDKACVVRNGIPVERFEPTAQRRAQARRLLGLEPHQPVIGSVGRLVELKNQASLIRALRPLIQRHPELKLVLVGDGPMRDALQSLAHEQGVLDRVQFTGARHDVGDLLPAFDVFALPSFTEGLSIALLEACASGLAVMASRVGGNPEIVRDDVTGLLVGTDDAAIVQALSRLLGDVGLRRRLGQAARDWVLDQASIEQMTRHYAALYQELLGRR